MMSIHAFRAALFAKPDANIYMHVGYFSTWFSQVELRITLIMAIIGGFKELDKFELLIKGMDARVKIERLRKLSKHSNKLGPKLQKRLKLFEEKIIPIRNKLVHSTIACDDKDRDIFYLTSVSKMPLEALGMSSHPKIGDPEKIRAIDIFEYGLWCHFFSEDLLSVLPFAIHGETLEIENPKTPERMEAH